MCFPLLRFQKLFTKLLCLFSLLEAWGLREKDATYQKHGASIAKLKYNAAYTLNQLSEGAEGDAGHDVD